MIKKIIKNLVKRAGYTLEKTKNEIEENIIPHGVIEDEFRDFHERCRPFTMTTPIEMYNLWYSIRHIARHRIPGDFVECGVWRGGSAMIAALTLLALGDNQRKLYLYDTYEGMPDATAEDVTHHGQDSAEVRGRLQKESGKWNFASFEEVRANLLSTGFPEERLVMVKGRVEDTIPGTLPGPISTLRLDTDFYKSTLHELNHLYPLLSSGGVLIVDDYDYWRGARQATDEYFEKHGVRLLLQRMDVGRIGVKP